MSTSFKIRVLARKGPGDTFKVVEREIPEIGEYFAVAASKAVEVAYAAQGRQSGDYLAQDLRTLECRLFHCTTRPTVTEA